MFGFHCFTFLSPMAACKAVSSLRTYDEYFISWKCKTGPTGRLDNTFVTMDFNGWYLQWWFCWQLTKSSWLLATIRLSHNKILGVYVCDMQSSNISKILVLLPDKQCTVWINAVPLKNSDINLNTVKDFSESDQGGVA